MTSAVTASASAEAGRSLIAVLQVLRLAVDRDNARAALGQQPHGRGADDAGRAGDDGDLAVQANSIGHVMRFPSGCPVVPGFCVVRRAAREPLIGGLFHLRRGLTSAPERRQAALSPPYSAC